MRSWTLCLEEIPVQGKRAALDNFGRGNNCQSEFAT
jgi:hypothetical protein